MKKVLILNYHKLIEGEGESVSNNHVSNERETTNKFHVSLSSFIDQLELIKSSNQHDTIITFDDGNLSDFTLAYPLLKEHGIKGMFFPVIDTIGTNDHLTWEHLRELVQNGFNIGSHTVSHRDLTKLTHDEVRMELKESKRMLEEKLGCEISALAVPYGKSSKYIRRIALDLGYTMVFSTAGGLSSPNDFYQHRWNVKSTTSIEAFEKIISGNRWTRLAKVSRSNLKRILDNPVGQLNHSNSARN